MLPSASRPPGPPAAPYPPLPKDKLNPATPSIYVSTVLVFIVIQFHIYIYVSTILVFIVLHFQVNAVLVFYCYIVLHLSKISCWFVINVNIHIIIIYTYVTVTNELLKVDFIMNVAICLL